MCIGAMPHTRICVPVYVNMCVCDCVCSQMHARVHGLQEMHVCARTSICVQEHARTQVGGHMHVLPVHCHPSPLALCQAWVVFQVPPVMGLRGGQVCPSLNQGLEQGQGWSARHVPARAIAPSARGGDRPLDGCRTHGRGWWWG